MKKLYLDVDGVILAKHNTKAAPGAVEFIDYITSYYDCYWLTTHCRDGNPNSLINMLSQYFPVECMIQLKQIKPTRWDALKTEAIDFTSDFYWLDDYVFNAEMEVLKSKSCIDRLIAVNLNNTNELKRIKERLMQQLPPFSIEKSNPIQR